MRALAPALLLACLPAQQEALGPAFAQEIRPLLQRHCTSCHGAKDPEADLDLEQLPATRPAQEWLGLLREIRERLRTGEMPPPEEPQPAPAERARLLAWCDERITALGVEIPPRAGRVTMRRLSRTEYQNTVRDLFGIREDLSALLPADELSHGFDNLGDAAGFSPLHFEQYAAAAARITERLLSSEDPLRPPVRKFAAEQMSVAAGEPRVQRGVMALVSRGAIQQRLRLPREGEYRLRVRGYGRQAGDEPARLGIAADGVQLALLEFPETVRGPGIRETTLWLRGGLQTLSFDFVNDHYAPRHPDPEQRDRNLYLDWVEVIGPVDRFVAPPEAAWFLDLIPRQGTPRERGRAALRELVRRAWRREPVGGEVNRLCDLVARTMREGGTFEEGLLLAIEAALLAPQFLFRVEPGGIAGTSSARQPLDDFALATRLSYYLWASTPDPELLALAAAGGLTQPADDGGDPLLAHARRMLVDPRSEGFVISFAGQWLELRMLALAQPDPARFPEFDAALRSDLRRETELFVAAILREGRSVQQLLDAPFTFVTPRLAHHYGLPAPDGEGFARIQLADATRGGLLGHGSILTLTSNATRTSPVRRGKWLLDVLLDAPPPAPPPGFDSFADEQAVHSAASMREQLAQHRNQPACAACHARIDPLGLALENFDTIGRWRSHERDRPIDASGQLPDGRKLDGVVELKRLLRDDPALVRGLLRKLFLFAVGRVPDAADLTALERLQAGLPPEPAFAELVLAIVRLDAFRARSVIP